MSVLPKVPHKPAVRAKHSVLPRLLTSHKPCVLTVTSCRRRRRGHGAAAIGFTRHRPRHVRRDGRGPMAARRRGSGRAGRDPLGRDCRVRHAHHARGDGEPRPQVRTVRFEATGLGVAGLVESGCGRRLVCPRNAACSRALMPATPCLQLLLWVQAEVSGMHG